MEQLQLIQSKIYEIRGQKLMFDFHLAEMYRIETRVLKQAVRRNIKRFDGEDFMFELTKDELSRSQIVTLNKNRGRATLNTCLSLSVSWVLQCSVVSSILTPQ